jgi:hypothetical protein
MGIADPVPGSVMAIDVEWPHPDDRVRARVRAAVRRMLGDACTAADVPLAACVVRDFGDGVTVVVPSCVPVSLLLEPLPRWLSLALDEHNRIVEPELRVRLRFALVLAGKDPQGAVELAARLAGLQEPRPASDLAVIVSDEVYREVVRDPAGYREVCLHNGLRAWIRG